MKSIFTLLLFFSAFSLSGQNQQPLSCHPLFEVDPETDKTPKLAKKADGWFDWYTSLQVHGKNVKLFQSTLFPDSNILVAYPDSVLGSVLRPAFDHSVGMVYDPRSGYYYGLPFQTSRFNTYHIDSIGIPYRYHRWNNDTSVKDTLLVKIYPASVMTVFSASYNPLFTVPYNYILNTGNGATYTVYRVLDADDTIGSDFGFISVPLNYAKVNWSNSGNNRFGITLSFIPGRKDYRTSAPFDTLDGRWNPHNKHNQFEFQVAHDYDIVIESPVSVPVGLRVNNNGLNAYTAIRYNMAGSNNGYYYEQVWSELDSQVQYLRFPRLLWHGQADISVKEIGNNGITLGDAYPNPVTGPVFSVDFQLPAPENLAFSIFDMRGQRVKNTPARTYSAGTNTVEIDVEGLRPGIYYYTVSSGVFRATKKFTVIRL